MPEKAFTVAVISDSHVQRMEDLPNEVREALRQSDAVIHLGDYTSPEMLQELRRLGNFHGIIGNHDSSINRKELNVMEVVQICGKRIGIIHGLFLPMARPKRMKAWFKKCYRDIDVLLFGHNHLVTNRRIGGVYMFNPGTVTGQFPATNATFGLLTLNGSVSGQVITLNYKIPYREKPFLRFLAMIIRLGIRWLEAWPYVDFFSLWTIGKRIWAKSALNFRLFSRRQTSSRQKEE